MEETLQYFITMNIKTRYFYFTSTSKWLTLLLIHFHHVSSDRETPHKGNVTSTVDVMTSAFFQTARFMKGLSGR